MKYKTSEQSSVDLPMSGPHPDPGNFERRFWWIAAGVALAVGVYFRFLGFWVGPLATDEFYTSQSIRFILESGLPEFPCGGYYTRGILFQYITAPLIFLGLAPETSLRVVSIVSNLSMLPAVFLLSRRLGGFRVAVAAIIILSLSIWEIEMARFGRVYAPFQAVFLWYAYHGYRLLETGDMKRWRWLFGLSFIGPLLWEGGIVLPLLNFLPIVMRRSIWRPSHLAAALTLFGTLLVFLVTNFRFMGPASALPPSSSSPMATGRIALPDSMGFLGPDMVATPLLAAAFFVLFLVLIFGLVQRVSRNRPDNGVVTTILAVAFCVLFNQLLLAFLVLAGASLIDWFRFKDIWSKKYSKIFLPLLGIAAIWVVVAIISYEEQGSTAAIKALISFPELLNSLFDPWLAIMPVMTVLLLASVGILFAKHLLMRKNETPELRFLLVVVITSLVVIGTTPTPYIETRYSFYIYALLVPLGLFSVRRLLPRNTRIQKIAQGLLLPVFLFVFALSSDFAVRHMINIDSYDANFRVGYGDRRARHYYPRFDFRSPAEFVNERSDPSDMVITTSVAVTQYLDKDSYVYLRKTDPRFHGQVCGFGNVERWTGRPVLADIASITALAETNPQYAAWLIADNQALQRTLPRAYIVEKAGYEAVFMSADKQFTVFHRAPGKPATQAH